MTPTEKAQYLREQGYYYSESLRMWIPPGSRTARLFDSVDAAYRYAKLRQAARDRRRLKAVGWEWAEGFDEKRPGGYWGWWDGDVYKGATRQEAIRILDKEQSQP